MEAAGTPVANNRRGQEGRGSSGQQKDSKETAQGWMGPTMPPSKKAQSPSSGSGATQGLSPLYREAEAADLSLSLSASFSKAEDEELTSLSWLHESTDLLNSFSHSGLRSVSPLQDSDGHLLPPTPPPPPPLTRVTPPPTTWPWE
ncbi:hypothetical protein UPYG_G00254080 [Umbra pygmaea]|uniref:Uncharacterized protein n=1 Tax=Umbra pygmaea TaxID=75934 RepID=A0ABD0WV67_UMBPY